MQGFDAKIERLRLRKSQFEIALETGIPNYVLSKFENGHASLSPEQIEKLKAALRRGRDAA